ncbi:unnamed protein product [Polarella glacialis]|uniref:Uncharacterized protein n=1 Tax=Polarella glacialis TaxID=89957 RepID=A0A813JQF5_POLGL|nr:unnamed protein product [Polarella glacialis]
MDPRGPPPLDRLLKRALFEDLDSFFTPLELPAAGNARGEGFPSFSRRLAAGELSGLGAAGGVGVRLVWLGSGRGAELWLNPARELLAALLAPSLVEADAPSAATALGRATTLLTGGPPGAASPPPRAFGARALLDALRRHALNAPRGGRAALAVAMTDGGVVDDTGRPIDCVADESVLAFCLGSAAEGTDWQRLARLAAAVFAALGLAECSFYSCLLNSSVRQAEVGSVPILHLCPVCLRKLAALLGPGSNWAVASHYRGLLAWTRKTKELEEEATWYKERLQVVTEQYVDDEESLKFCFSTAPILVSAPPAPEAPAARRVAVLAAAAVEAEPEELEVSPAEASALLRAPPGGSCSLSVVLSGRRGSLTALNGRYLPAGSSGGRLAFRLAGEPGSHPGLELFLYYVSESDSWSLGPVLGDESVYADCGPVGADCRDLAQTWRVWDGKAWAEDRKLSAKVMRTRVATPALDCTRHSELNESPPQHARQCGAMCRGPAASLRPSKILAMSGIGGSSGSGSGFATGSLTRPFGRNPPSFIPASPGPASEDGSESGPRRSGSRLLISAASADEQDAYSQKQDEIRKMQEANRSLLRRVTSSGNVTPAKTPERAAPFLQGRQSDQASPPIWPLPLPLAARLSPGSSAGVGSAQKGGLGSFLPGEEAATHQPVQNLNALMATRAPNLKLLDDNRRLADQVGGLQAEVLDLRFTVAEITTRGDRLGDALSSAEMRNSELGDENEKLQSANLMLQRQPGGSEQTVNQVARSYVTNLVRSALQANGGIETAGTLRAERAAVVGELQGLTDRLRSECREACDSRDLAEQKLQAVRAEHRAAQSTAESAVAVADQVVEEHLASAQRQLASLQEALASREAEVHQLRASQGTGASPDVESQQLRAQLRSAEVSAKVAAQRAEVAIKKSDMQSSKLQEELQDALHRASTAGELQAKTATATEAAVAVLKESHVQQLEQHQACLAEETKKKMGATMKKQKELQAQGAQLKEEAEEAAAKAKEVERQMHSKLQDMRQDTQRTQGRLSKKLQGVQAEWIAERDAAQAANQELEQHASSISQLGEMKVEHGSRQAALRSECVELQQRISLDAAQAANQELEQHASSISQLGEMRVEHGSRQAALRSECAELQQRISLGEASLEADRSIMHSEVEAADSRAEQAEQHCKEQELQVAQLRRTLKEAQLSAGELQQTLEDGQAEARLEIKRTEAAYAEMTTLRIEVAEARADADGVLEEHEALLDALRREHDAAGSQLQSLLHEAQDKQRKLGHLQGDDLDGSEVLDVFTDACPTPKSILSGWSSNVVSKPPAFNWQQPSPHGSATHSLPAASPKAVALALSDCEADDEIRFTAFKEREKALRLSVAQAEPMGRQTELLCRTELQCQELFKEVSTAAQELALARNELAQEQSQASHLEMQCVARARAASTASEAGTELLSQLDEVELELRTVKPQVKLCGAADRAQLEAQAAKAWSVQAEAAEEDRTVFRTELLQMQRSLKRELTVVDDGQAARGREAKFELQVDSLRHGREEASSELRETQKMIAAERKEFEAAVVQAKREGRREREAREADRDILAAELSQFQDEHLLLQEKLRALEERELPEMRALLEESQAAVWEKSRRGRSELIAEKRGLELAQRHTASAEEAREEAEQKVAGIEHKEKLAKEQLHQAREDKMRDRQAMEKQVAKLRHELLQQRQREEDLLKLRRQDELGGTRQLQEHQAQLTQRQRQAERHAVELQEHQQRYEVAELRCQELHLAEVQASQNHQVLEVKLQGREEQAQAAESWGQEMSSRLQDAEAQRQKSEQAGAQAAAMALFSRRFLGAARREARMLVTMSTGAAHAAVEAEGGEGGEDADGASSDMKAFDVAWTSGDEPEAIISKIFSSISSQLSDLSRENAELHAVPVARRRSPLGPGSAVASNGHSNGQSDAAGKIAALQKELIKLREHNQELELEHSRRGPASAENAGADPSSSAATERTVPKPIDVTAALATEGLKQRMKQLQAVRNRAESEVEQLKQELVKRTKAFREDTETFQAEIARTRSELQQRLDAEKAEADQKLQASERRSRVLEAKLKGRVESQRQLQAEKEAVEDQLGIAARQLEALLVDEGKDGGLQKDLAGLSKQFEQLHSKHRAQLARTGEQSKLLQREQASCQSLQEQVVHAEQEIKARDEEVQTLRQQGTAFQREVQQVHRQMAELQVQGLKKQEDHDYEVAEVKRQEQRQVQISQELKEELQRFNHELYQTRESAKAQYQARLGKDGPLQLLVQTEEDLRQVKAALEESHIERRRLERDIKSLRPGTEAEKQLGGSGLLQALDEIQQTLSVRESALQELRPEIERDFGEFARSVGYQGDAGA